MLLSFPCGTGSNRTAEPRRHIPWFRSHSDGWDLLLHSQPHCWPGHQDCFRHRNHNGCRSIQTGRRGPCALYKLLWCSRVLGMLQWLELASRFQTTPQRLNWNVHKPRGRGRLGQGTIFTDSREAGRTKGALKGPYTIKRARLVSTRRARHPASILSPPGCYRGRSFASRTWRQGNGLLLRHYGSAVSRHLNAYHRTLPLSFCPFWSLFRFEMHTAAQRLHLRRTK